MRDKRERGLVAMSEGEPTLLLLAVCSLGPSRERGSGQKHMGIVGVRGDGEPVQSPDKSCSKPLTLACHKSGDAGQRHRV